MKKLTYFQLLAVLLGTLTWYSSEAAPVSLESERLFYDRFHVPPLTLGSGSGPKPLNAQGGQHTIFHPELRQEIRFSVVSAGSFFAREVETRPSGFWFLFTPSNIEDSQYLTGHAQILVNGKLHTRSGETSIRDLQTLPMAQSDLSGSEPAGVRLSRVAKTSWFVAQFFQLPEKTVEVLDKFFSERVYFYYFGSDSTYRVPFRMFPFTETTGGDETRWSKVGLDQVRGENCNTFVWSFLFPYWLKARGDLRMSGISDELGQVEVAQSPAMQVFLNSKTAQHTFLVSDLKQAANRPFEELPQSEQLFGLGSTCAQRLNASFDSPMEPPAVF